MKNGSRKPWRNTEVAENKTPRSNKNPFEVLKTLETVEDYYEDEISKAKHRQPGKLRSYYLFSDETVAQLFLLKKVTLLPTYSHF